MSGGGGRRHLVADSQESEIRKLSVKRKQYLDRHCLLCRPKGAHRRRKVRVASSTGTWMAPKVFNLMEQSAFEVLIPSLRRLRDLVFTSDRVCLNFIRTEKMFADGALLFLAELRRAKRHSGKQVQFTCVPPENEKVSQVLQQIGVFELLGVAPGVAPVDDDVVSWKFAHGDQVEGAKYEDVLAAYDGEIASELLEGLYNGITEAMTNVVGHAYDMPRADGWKAKSREWWMFSQAKDEELTVVFCDLGAGIPRTLPLKRPGVWKKLLQFGRSTDAQAIEYALKDSISRTKLDYRGKGLGQIVRAVSAEAAGRVAIFSNRGLLYRRPSLAMKRVELPDSILGTLICWTLPLKSKEKS
jgi:hypothetical protein